MKEKQSPRRKVRKLDSMLEAEQEVEIESPVKKEAPKARTRASPSLDTVIGGRYDTQKGPWTGNDSLISRKASVD